MRLLVERIDVDLDEGRLDLHLHDLAAPFRPVPPGDYEGDPEPGKHAEAPAEAAE